MRKEGRVCSCRWVGWGRGGESAHAGELVEGGGESLFIQVSWLREEGCHLLGWEVGRAIGVAAALVLCVKVLLLLSDTNCVWVSFFLYKMIMILPV